MAIDAMAILRHFYPDDTPLRRLLLTHSRQVADRALLIAERHPELHLDTGLMERGALLHDVGILRCDAPGILCFGTEPYICHGLLGAEMLRSLAGQTVKGNTLAVEQLEPLARFCERHTGTGLSRQQILSQQLPLPAQDFLPETVEEQVVCYADKFYSKSHPERERTVEQAALSLKKFGEDVYHKFLRWADRFE